MSIYENWQSVMEGFEKSQDFRTIPLPEHYNHHFVTWLVKNHYPPVEMKSILELDGLVIDKKLAKVKLPNGKEVSPPRKIFLLLHMLASNRNRVINREEILRWVWGTEVCVTDRTVDVHVKKIRDILGQDSIITVKGVGYRFNREGCTCKRSPLLKIKNKK